MVWFFNITVWKFEKINKFYLVLRDLWEMGNNLKIIME